MRLNENTHIIRRTASLFTYWNDRITRYFVIGEAKAFDESTGRLKLDVDWPVGLLVWKFVYSSEAPDGPAKPAGWLTPYLTGDPDDTETPNERGTRRNRCYYPCCAKQKNSNRLYTKRIKDSRGRGSGVGGCADKGAFRRKAKTTGRRTKKLPLIRWRCQDGQNTGGFYKC